jgi:hypothetical protein
LARTSDCKRPMSDMPPMRPPSALLVHSAGPCELWEMRRKAGHPPSHRLISESTHTSLGFQMPYLRPRGHLLPVLPRFGLAQATKSLSDDRVWAKGANPGMSGGVWVGRSGGDHHERHG